MPVEIAGAVMVLAAYALSQAGRLDLTSPRYLLLNVIGSAALTASALAGRDWGFVILNGTWGLVALWSLLRGAPRQTPD